MRVTATRAVTVQTTSGEKVNLGEGHSADVDGRTYGDDHMFIKAGYLVKDKQPEQQPKQSRKQKQEEPKEDSADKE